MNQDIKRMDKSDVNGFSKIVYSYLPFWPVLMIAVCLSLALAFFYNKTQTPVYLASAKALLKDPQKGSDTKVLDALNIFSEKKIVENEVIVLRSLLLMEQVVRSLDLYATVFQEGRFRNQELYGKMSPVHFVPVNKNEEFVPSELYFTIDNKNQWIQISGKNYRFNDQININGAVFNIISEPLFQPQQPNVKYQLKISPVSLVASRIIDDLKGAPLSYNSTVIDMNLETSVPEKGSDILRKLFEFYNKAGIEDKNQMAVKTLHFIDLRLATVTGQLDTVESNIETYKTKFGIGDLGNQAMAYLDNIKEFDKSNSLLELQLELLSDLNGYLQQKKNDKGIVPSVALLGDPTLKSLLDQLYEAEFELQKVKSISGDKSNVVLVATEKVKKIKSDINDNIANLKNNLSTQRSFNEAKIVRNQNLFTSLPSKEKGLLDISRQQAIKNNIYNYLLQKREETALSSAATTSDIRILENVYSHHAIKPVPKKLYLIAIFFAFGFFLLYVFLKEKLKNKILFRAEIDNDTMVPVVGEILRSKSKDVIAINEGKRTIIAEQFRVLRTNLSFMGFDHNNNTLLVTSGISGEGKSYISLNLAISLTLTGKKVALLELDLRKPKLSGLLNTEKEPGISNFLVNQVSMEQIVKKTEIANLFLITSGSLPPNPTELIARKEFGELVAKLKSEFDFLVIDSAPLGPVADAQLIASFAAVNLFVVRHNHTPKSFISQIEKYRLQGKFSNMGIVFNGILPRGTSFFNYALGGYGNGYNYGYGEGEGGYAYDDKDGYFDNEAEKPGYRNIWDAIAFFRRSKKK